MPSTICTEQMAARLVKDSSIPSLQVLVQVSSVYHKGVLRGWECLELILVTEVLEYSLLTLVHSMHIMLKPFL